MAIPKVCGIETEFGEQADPGFRRSVAESTPLGRWGRPQDVADAALYLASPEDRKSVV